MRITAFDRATVKAWIVKCGMSVDEVDLISENDNQYRVSINNGHCYFQISRHSDFEYDALVRYAHNKTAKQLPRQDINKLWMSFIKWSKGVRPEIEERRNV